MRTATFTKQTLREGFVFVNAKAEELRKRCEQLETLRRKYHVVSKYGNIGLNF